MALTCDQKYMWSPLSPVCEMAVCFSKKQYTYLFLYGNELLLNNSLVGRRYGLEVELPEAKQEQLNLCLEGRTEIADKFS